MFLTLRTFLHNVLAETICVILFSICLVANTLKETKWFFQYVNVNLWCLASTIMPEASDIFSYYKKNGYIDTIQGINYKEALDNSQNIDYSILELEDFGRVGICICKDLNDENTVLFHKLIRTNILLVPAFSKSLSLISEAENIADMYNCITVFANSCSARCKHWDDNMDIGFIVLPAKKGTSNKCLVHKYSAKNCINTCENECLCKVFSIVFDEISECEGKYSFNLQEEILS